MTNEEIQNLKGSALKEKAAELNIKGRSKMNVEELRVAIADAEANRIAREYVETVARPVIARNPSPFAPVHEVRPLTTDARLDNYRRANGTDRITPAQARRLRKNDHTGMVFVGNTANLGRHHGE